MRGTTLWRVVPKISIRKKRLISPLAFSSYQSTPLLFSRHTRRLHFQSGKLRCIDIDAMENRFPSLCFRFWDASTYIGEPTFHFSPAEMNRSE